MAVADAPFSQFHTEIETGPVTSRLIPGGGKVAPGAVQLNVEALTGAPTVANYLALVAGNYLDLQYKGNDGTVQFSRVVFHNQHGHAIYCWVDGRNALVGFVKANIVGMTVLS